MTRTSKFKAAFEKVKISDKKVKKLLNEVDGEIISEAIIEEAKEELGFCLWSQIISSLNDEDKLFEIVKEVSIEVSCFPRILAHSVINVRSL